MKEIKYHHWEEEITETALDYHPINSYATKLKEWVKALTRVGVKVLPPKKGWRLIDQIMEKRR